MNTIPRRVLALAAGFCASVGMSNPAVAAETVASAAPVVVELFTSQSCSSCPPAEAYLGELAGRAGILALEFHVDYWNDLVYGFAGRWTDVHSDRVYTARQRAYAQVLPGGVYTPQMVIDGRAQAVGSNRGAVEAAIAEAAKRPRATLVVATTSAGKTILNLKGPIGVAAEVWRIDFRVREETRVRAGENRGQTLVNHHIVTAMTRLGAWPFDADRAIFDASGPVLNGRSGPPDMGCALLVQGANQGPILAAAACPKVS